MLQSLKYSNLVLRLGLAAVFLGFGIDKFLYPDYWVNAWLPHSVAVLIAHIKMGPRDFIYLNGIFEVLVGTSLVANIFTRLFSFLSVLFLLGIFAFHVRSFNEVLVRDIGLMGGFLALVLWPDRRFA